MTDGEPRFHLIGAGLSVRCRPLARTNHRQAVPKTRTSGLRPTTFEIRPSQTEVRMRDSSTRIVNELPSGAIHELPLPKPLQSLCAHLMDRASRLGC